MARKSQRLSESSTAARSHKRAGSNSEISHVGTKRSKGTKAAPPTTQAVKASNGGDNAEHLEDPSDIEADSAASENASNFGAEDEESTPSAEDDDEEFDEEDDPPKPSKKSTPVKRQVSRGSTGSSQNEKSKSASTTGYGPGTQVITKKPKPRPAGQTPYKDDTIHPNTLLFLQELKANNSRQWLKAHDADFRASEKDFYSFVENLTGALTQVDETVPELPVKDVIFRIYRDVRFSPDPTPYKPFFSAAWSRTGRKGPYAHYYVQIAHKETFIGGGLWHPEAAPMAAMRNAIDRNPDGLKSVLMKAGVRRSFLGNKSASQAVKAFVEANSENALKTKPKGYNADHPDLDLLRLRNYTVGKKLTDEEVLGPGGLDRITQVFADMVPFITYLNSVIMPDDARDDDAGDEDEEE